MRPRPASSSSSSDLVFFIPLHHHHPGERAPLTLFLAHGRHARGGGNRPSPTFGVYKLGRKSPAGLAMASIGGLKARGGGSRSALALSAVARSRFVQRLSRHATARGPEGGASQTQREEARVALPSQSTRDPIQAGEHAKGGQGGRNVVAATVVREPREEEQPQEKLREEQREKLHEKPREEEQPQEKLREEQREKLHEKPREELHEEQQAE